MGLITLTDLEDLRAWADTCRPGEPLDPSYWTTVKLIAAVPDRTCSTRFRIAVECAYICSEETDSGSILLDAIVECDPAWSQAVIDNDLEGKSPVVEVTLSTETIGVLRHCAPSIAEGLDIAAERLYREAHGVGPDAAIGELEIRIAKLEEALVHVLDHTAPLTIEDRARDALSRLDDELILRLAVEAVLVERECVRLQAEQLGVSADERLRRLQAYKQALEDLAIEADDAQRIDQARFDADVAVALAAPRAKEGA